MIAGHKSNYLICVQLQRPTEESDVYTDVSLLFIYFIERLIQTWPWLQALGITVESVHSYRGTLWSIV